MYTVESAGPMHDDHRLYRKAWPVYCRMENREAAKFMDCSVVGYKVKFGTWFRRREREWVVWCPGIDVMTQARTKKKALESIREAVELWFESCIERGVLDKALNEAGFNKVPANEETPEDVDCVDVIRRPATQFSAGTSISFSLGHHEGSDYIEGIIPACIAARQLGEAARARG